MRKNPTFYCFNNVISLTYVFYLILHLVYKFLYLVNCFRLFLIFHVLVAFVNYYIKRICYVMLC